MQKPFIHCLSVFILLMGSSLNAYNSKISKVQTKTFQLPVKSELRSAAATDNTLWVAGDKSTVYISLDNGKQWKNISPDTKLLQTKDFNFRDIAVLNDDTAIVMSVGNADESRLLITRDQGLHWQLLRTNLQPKGFYDSIAFWDENNGVLLGDPVNGHFVIEITSDQGKSWSRITPEKLPKMSVNEAAFAASGNTLITGKTGQLWFITGGLSANVYTSTDSGTSWKKSALPLEDSTATSGGYALALNQQKQLFALGGNYLKRDAKYVNSAKLIEGQWHAVDNGSNGLRTAMACVTKFCISTGKLSSDISYDDGLTWQPLSDKGFYTLASNNSIILAAGNEGRIVIFEQL